MPINNVSSVARQDPMEDLLLENKLFYDDMEEIARESRNEEWLRNIARARIEKEREIRASFAQQRQTEFQQQLERQQGDAEYEATQISPIGNAARTAARVAVPGFGVSELVKTLTERHRRSY